jgi:MFS family permease
MENKRKEKEYKDLINIFYSQKIPGALLSLRFGPKIVLFFSILISSLLTLLTPLAANSSFITLFVCRLLIGIAHVNKKFDIFFLVNNLNLFCD